MAGFHCIIDSRLGHSKLDFCFPSGRFSNYMRAGGLFPLSIMVFSTEFGTTHYINGHIWPGDLKTR